MRAQSSLGKRLHCNDVREPADWQITLKEHTWPHRRLVPRTRSCNRSRRPRASRGRRGILHARTSRRRTQRTWRQKLSNDDKHHQGRAASDTPSGACRNRARTSSSQTSRRRRSCRWPCQRPRFSRGASKFSSGAAGCKRLLGSLVALEPRLTDYLTRGVDGEACSVSMGPLPRCLRPCLFPTAEPAPPRGPGRAALVPATAQTEERRYPSRS
jgi:hypothetical protein